MLLPAWLILLVLSHPCGCGSFYSACVRHRFSGLLALSPADCRRSCPCMFLQFFFIRSLSAGCFISSVFVSGFPTLTPLLGAGSFNSSIQVRSVVEVKIWRPASFFFSIFSLVVHLLCPCCAPLRASCRFVTPLLWEGRDLAGAVCTSRSFPTLPFSPVYG